MEVIPLGPLGRAVRFVALAGGLAFTLVPVLWVASLALRPAGAVTFPVSLLPPSLTLENLRTILFTDLGIGPRPYLNAAFYGISCGVITAIISLMGGYALVRYDLAFGRALLLVFLALNFLPAAARLIPLFLLYVQLGLYDTQLGVPGPRRWHAGSCCRWRCRGCSWSRRSPSSTAGTRSRCRSS
ncbi:MAG: carbohydrate ABC transporter permease [Chloroflexi bacterium]|nr:MAG: carbohydrate ABC transporter permease [Chloroflexota bacterium]